MGKFFALSTQPYEKAKTSEDLAEFDRKACGLGVGQR